MHEGSYFTYMMTSRSRTLNIGVTGDLLKRVFQHKWKEHEGFTARYNCDRLICFERHQDIQTVIAREKEVRGWRRARKIALIESTSPRVSCPHPFRKERGKDGATRRLPSQRDSARLALQRNSRRY